jgi:hypothetical protein
MAVPVKPRPEPDPGSAPEPEPAAETGPPPWSGPWADDARRLFQAIQGEGLAVLGRTGPEVLDKVSELAAGLAATLRSLDLDPQPGPGADPAPEAGAGTPSEQSAPGPESAPGPPTSTVRIDVTD